MVKSSIFCIFILLAAPKGVQQSQDKVELSKKTVAKEILYETENTSYEAEYSMLKPSEVKTQETLPEAKPQKRAELVTARGMLGWS